MPQRRNQRAAVEDLWRKSDGSRSKRDGVGLRWRARWVDRQGKERTKAFHRKTDAQQHVNEVTTALTTHTYVDPKSGRTPVGVVVQRWLDRRRGNVKAKTMEGYESLARKRILPRWGDVPLDAVDPGSIDAWIKGLQQGGDAVSALRARQAGIILRASLQVAVSSNLLAKNPADEVELPTGDGKRKGVRLTGAELWRVADEMPTSVDRALLLTLAMTGIRWGEATALQVGAVDLLRRRLTVERTYTDMNGEIITGVPKNHATRWVPIAPTVARELQPLVQDKAAEDDVFRTSSGAVFRHRNWGRRVFRPALERAGCDTSMRIHDLRGTAASLAIAAGANILALQRMLGHESAAMTLDVYGALYESDLTGLGDQIESAAYSLRTGEHESVGVSGRKAL